VGGQRVFRRKEDMLFLGLVAELSFAPVDCSGRDGGLALSRIRIWKWREALTDSVDACLAWQLVML
jgi:hypothetical protein